MHFTYIRSTRYTVLYLYRISLIRRLGPRVVIESTSGCKKMHLVKRLEVCAPKGTAGYRR